MAFIHAQSCECTKSELDLFIVPPTQTSIESGTLVEYNPISTISQGTLIEFSITGAGQDYLDLASTQLYVRAQIAKANDDAIDNTDHVGPTKNTASQKQGRILSHVLCRRGSIQKSNFGM